MSARAPSFIDIDDKRYPWGTLITRRQEQRAAGFLSLMPRPVSMRARGQKPLVRVILLQWKKDS